MSVLMDIGIDRSSTELNSDRYLDENGKVVIRAANVHADLRLQILTMAG